MPAWPVRASAELATKAPWGATIRARFRPWPSLRPEVGLAVRAAIKTAGTSPARTTPVTSSALLTVVPVVPRPALTGRAPQRDHLHRRGFGGSLGGTCSVRQGLTIARLRKGISLRDFGSRGRSNASSLRCFRGVFWWSFLKA